MKKICISIFFAFFLIHSYSQNQLSGIVLDAGTNEPVDLATVYINGTTIGTYTDEKGKFTLKDLEYPAELVVSRLSYENKVLRIEKPLEKALIIKISASAVSLAEVKVEDRNQRQKNIAEFRNAFLGVDEFGREARLENTDALVFSRDYVKKSLGGSIKIDGGEKSAMTIERPVNLKAETRAPLIVDQPKLGYRIRVDLVTFQKTYGEGLLSPAQSYWLGYYFFEPYEVKRKGKQRRFEKNRLKAYYHSTQHFLRSLYKKELAENGYRIYKRITNKEDKSVRYVEYSLYDHLDYREDGLMTINGLKDQELIIFYYGDNRGRPKDLSRKKGRQPVSSQIQFFDDPCLVRENGTMPNYSILFGGPISEKLTGAMLPDNYEVGK